MIIGIFLMKRFKYIAFFIAEVLLHGICSAQNQKADSLKIVLLNTQGQQRVDCLNSISKEYIYEIPDSALIYASKAFWEAKKINYARGMGDAMFNTGKAETDFSVREQCFLNAISFYHESGNTDTVAQVHFQLAKALTALADYNGALENFKKAEYYYLKANDTLNWGPTLTFTGVTYGHCGNYEKAFEYAYKALQVRQKNNETAGVLWAYCNLATLFQNVEDYHSAIDYYYNKCLEYAKKQGTNWDPYYDKMSECYWQLKLYDSAFFYLNIYLKLIFPDSAQLNRELNNPFCNNSAIGQWWLMKKDYDQALRVFLSLLKMSEAIHDRTSQLDLLPYIGDAYAEKKDFQNALLYSRRLLNMGLQTGNTLATRNGTKMLWEIYNQQKEVDSAYKYYSLYITLRDSVTNYRFVSQMSSFKEASNKEKREIQFNEEMQRQSLIRKILIGFLLLFVLLSLIILRNVTLNRRNEKLREEQLKSELNLQRLESERKETALQIKSTELEMQALRAQMNPHFIFNSLNSINRFIMQDNRGQASQYLTKFSRLVRLILQNSQAELISLESELESLELYLDLEALRFDYHFAYKISVSHDLDISLSKVPPLIIQPYVENAIWHGLMHKEEKGQLDIELFQENDFIFIKITDNGIGRKKAAELTSKSATKHKSMGLRITADRIAVLSRSQTADSGVTINDLVNPDGTAAGTEVIIKIPVIYD